MKFAVVLVVGANPAMTACGKDSSEKLADRVEAVADNRADAIEAADRNVAAMRQAQRDAIYANQAAAVR